MKFFSRLAALGICLLAATAFIGNRPAAAQEGTSTPHQVFYTSDVSRVRKGLWHEDPVVTVTYDAADPDIPAIPENSQAVLTVQASASGVKTLVLCVKFPEGGGINISNADPVANDIAANLDGGTAFGGLSIGTDASGAYRLTMQVKAAGTARNIVWGGTSGVPPAPQSTGSLMSAFGGSTMRNIVWGGTSGVPPKSVTVLSQAVAETAQAF